MQLSDLMCTVSRIFSPPPRLQGRQRMIIPSLRDTRNERMTVKVDAQCKDCATLLAGHLYRWVKPFPEKATLKSWSADGRCFQGMDIEVFQNYVMEHFDLCTDDNHPWLLDRSIAALIWNVCTDDGSPLPLASWQIETDLKRKAIR